MPFVKPPLDGTLSLPEIFDFHWRYNPTHPIFRYESSSSPLSNRGENSAGDVEVVTITWSHAVRAVHNAAAYLERICATSERPIPKGSIIAVLGNIGIMRAGFQAFPMSPRNPIPAIMHLLHETGARHVLVSSDPGIQRLVAGLGALSHTAQSPLSTVPPQTYQPPFGSVGGDEEDVLMEDEEDDGEFQFIPLPTFEYLFDAGGENFEPSTPIPHLPDRSTALILHSTGTMSMPKPIRISALELVGHTLSLRNEDDFSSVVWSVHSVPMFHATGVVMMVWTVAAGCTISSFPPDNLHILPNPDRVLESVVASKSNTLICVPYYLEAWSRSPQHIQTLKRLKRVFFIGAPLYSETGDYLSSLGVRLVPLYGVTEFGVPVDIPGKYAGSMEDWEYFQFSSRFQIELIPSHNDVYHLVLLNEHIKLSPLLNCEVNGIKMYNTHDLVQRHPTKPHLWRIYGRSDEQLTHSTGEKTNPVPIELRLKKHPKIRNAVVFGHGRFLPGVLIEIAPEWTVDPSNRKETTRLRNEIWFYMDQINEFSPVHSRVVKEMMVLADPNRPFEVNPKGLVQRKYMVLSAYEAQIEEAYATAHLSFPPGLPSPEAWELEDCVGLVRQIVQGVVGCAVDEDADLVAVGCDSIQMIRIRQTILTALHHGAAKISYRRIPPSFIYAHPSIRALGEFVMKIVLQGHGFGIAVGGGGPGGLVSHRIVEMEDMVRKYTSGVVPYGATTGIPSSSSSGARKVRKWMRVKQRTVAGRGDIVLLTGSTGILGAHILERLEKDMTVERIYAFNRSERRCSSSSSNSSGGGGGESHTSRSILERHEEVFQKYALDSVVLESEKIVYVEWDMVDSKTLGLEATLYEKLLSEVNYIIHAAWPANPNVRMTSLEPLLVGTRNLLDFALGSRLPNLPRFVFLSSMFIFSNWVGGPRSPESPNTRPTSALGQGYAESKWIAERIIDHIADQTSLPSTIIRVGHLCGGRNGVWDTRHWVPTLVRSAQVVKCLPRPQGDITWIPVHYAAAAIVEIAMHGPGQTDSSSSTLSARSPSPGTSPPPPPPASSPFPSTPASPVTPTTPTLMSSSFATHSDTSSSGPAGGGSGGRAAGGGQGLGGASTKQDTTTIRYYNLSHPHPTTVLSVFSILSRQLHVDLVDYETWLAALHATRLSPDDPPAGDSSHAQMHLPHISENMEVGTSTSSPAISSSASPPAASTRSPGDTESSIDMVYMNNPALHLFDFFRALYKPVKPWSKDKEAFGFPLAVTERAVRDAPGTLGTLQELTEKDVLGWVRYWRNARFLV